MTPHLHPARRPTSLVFESRGIRFTPPPTRPRRPWIRYPKDIDPSGLERAIALFAIAVVAITCWPEVVGLVTAVFDGVSGGLQVAVEAGR